MNWCTFRKTWSLRDSGVATASRSRSVDGGTQRRLLAEGAAMPSWKFIFYWFYNYPADKRNVDLPSPMHELLVAPVAWGSPWWGRSSAGNQLRVRCFAFAWRKGFSFGKVDQLPAKTLRFKLRIYSKQFDFNFLYLNTEINNFEYIYYIFLQGIYFNNVGNLKEYYKNLRYTSSYTKRNR